MKTAKQLNSCIHGHRFYKSSDCQVCTICESEQQPKEEWLR